MNAKHLTVALLSAALLAGCNDAGPLAPLSSSPGASNDGIDPPHPPIEIEDPVMPLPPAEWGDDDQGGKRSSNSETPPVKPLPPPTDEDTPPLLPQPPQDDDQPPVKPLPPPQDDGQGRNLSSNSKLTPEFPMPPIEENPPNEERPDDPPVKPLPPPEQDEDSDR